jgi:hypothetical protein
MWMFKPVGALDHIFHLNHTLITIGKMTIQYPVTIAIFLGRMGNDRKQQIISIVLWVGIFSLTEAIAHYAGTLTYYNGWNYGWDVIFNIMMFSMLLLHYKRPLIAWILVLPITLGLWWIFDVPFSVLK